mmetsp:Transcript_55205/g.118692  ORF Transcript_55205/g.118692 Transcript_55205/m.118692 type:complete len:694 (+) Transcript_55205:37-2118(+)
MAHVHVLLVLILSAVVASDAVVRLATAADITQCLTIVAGKHVAMKECLDGKGTYWSWPAGLPMHSYEGSQVGTGVEGPIQVAHQSQCLLGDLVVQGCSGDPDQAIWTWDPRTLQIRLKGVDAHCLGLSPTNSGEVAIVQCAQNSPKVEQNGHGIPAEQTWVVLPEHRPQLAILEELAFPLRVSGRWVIDSTGRRVKLSGVNWSGSHMKQLVVGGLHTARLETLVKSIKHMGFNSVRMNFALSMLKVGTSQFLPAPHPALLKANPQLTGMSALEVFDRIVQAITDEGLLVVLNNHMSEAGWCCSGDDGNELWFTEEYSIEDWLDALTFMAERYSSNKRVIGIDIRHEPRVQDRTATVPWWGLETRVTKPLGYQFVDWRQAAARGSVAVWKGNPSALVLIEGFLYATNLAYVKKRPMSFAQECLNSRVVYSLHEYSWFSSIYLFWEGLKNRFNPFTFFSDLHALESATEEGARFHQDDSDVSYKRWRDMRIEASYFLHTEDSAPIWVSEFGTSGKSDAHWNHTQRFMREMDVDWSYWPLDAERVPADFPNAGDRGIPETYGIFDSGRRDWKAVVGWKLQELIALQPPLDAGRLHKVPHTCDFEPDANTEASLEPSDMWLFLRTTDTGPIFFLAVTLPLLVFCGGCLALCGRQSSGRGDAEGSVQAQLNGYAEGFVPTQRLKSDNYYSYSQDLQDR